MAGPSNPQSAQPNSGAPQPGAGGNIPYDPSKNVLDLVEAANKRQDDLRLAAKELADAKSAHQKEISDLRAVHAETLRTSDLDRLDKTRQVDVLAASASAAALSTAVQTLASTADRNADALRNLVNATAATMAKQTSDQAATLSAATDSLVKDINARIAELQKSSYQGVGKSSVADPMLAELIVEMRALVKGSDRRTGKSEGMSDTAKLIVSGVGLFATLLSIGAVLVALVLFLNRTPAQAPIYTPAPYGTVLPSTPPTQQPPR